MRLMPRAAAPLLALLAAAAPLGASDPVLGAQFSMAFPASDLKSLAASSDGLSIGLSGLVDFGGGHALRPRLDYATFHGLDAVATGTLLPKGSALHAQASVDQFSLGADYLFGLRRSVDAGPYLLAGIGAISTHWTSDLTLTGTPAAQARMTFRKTSPYAQVGLGWQFTPAFGLEIRQQVSTLDSDVSLEVRGAGGQPSLAIPVATGRLNLGVTYLTAAVRF